MVKEILADYIAKICVVYLDNMFIFRTSIQEMDNNIKLIFQKLQEHNLKIQLTNAIFCERN